MTLQESTAPDFNREVFLRCMDSQSGGRQSLDPESVFIAGSVDSTNTRLKAMLSESGALLSPDGSLTSQGKRLHKTVLASSSQSAGYGRMSRTFYSPPDSGIYFSFIYIPQPRLLTPAFYTVSCAVAVSLAVEELLGIKTSVKWVNDILVDGKKACGILSEAFCPAGSEAVQALVIGIGINLRTSGQHLPDEIKNTAVGILDGIDPKNFSRSLLLAKIISRCFDFLDAGMDIWPQVIGEYKKRSYLDGKTVNVTPLIGQSKTAYPAKVIGITHNAELEVECEDGTIKTLSTGEVSLHV